MEGGPRRTFEQRELLYFAISRFFSGPLFLILMLIAGDEISAPLLICMGVGMAYTFSTVLLAASRHWELIGVPQYVFGDLSALALVMALSGGPESQVQVVFFLWTLGMSLLVTPRGVVACLAASAGTFLLVSIPFVAGGPLSIDDPELQALLLAEISLLWIGAITIAMAYALRDRRAGVERLAASRRRLLADALSAEDRARRRLSRHLNQETLQVLLSAGQDLDAARPGEERLLVRARERIRLAVRQLREIVRELHPSALQRGGLAEALDATAERAAAECGFSVDVRVDPSAAGSHDSLLASVGRELMSNVAKHSGADAVSVTVGVSGPDVVLEVADDGRGFEAGEVLDLTPAEHVGLESSRERVEACGGTLAVSSAPGEGTLVRVAIPREEDAGGPREGFRARLADLARLSGQRELVYVGRIRVATVAVFVASTAIAGDGFSALLIVMLALSCVYVGAHLAIASGPAWTKLDARWLLPLDLTVLGLVLAASGGPQSQVSVVYFVWPIAMCLILRPPMVAAALVGAMVSFAAVSLPFVLDGPIDLGNPDFEALLLVEVTLAWIGTVALVAVTSFDSRRREVEELSSARQRILADALSAEDRARRRLSVALHDDALQVLLAAGQDLDAGVGGSEPDSSLDRAREELRLAVRSLRETARGLNPTATEYGGLAAGLDAVTERASRMGGFAVDVRVDPAIDGAQDELLVSLAREFATNAAKHADADHLSLVVTREADALSLEVTDDGRGMADWEFDQLGQDGHIGLASCFERVEAAGGTLDIEVPEGGGTRVSARLPLEPVSDPRTAALASP